MTTLSASEPLTDVTTVLAAGALRRDREGAPDAATPALLAGAGLLRAYPAASPADAATWVREISTVDASVGQALAAHHAAAALSPVTDRTGWHALATADAVVDDGADAYVVISGTAALSASGLLARHLVLDRVPGADGSHRTVVVGTDAAGVTVTAGPPGFGQRAAPVATATFYRVSVPAGHVGPADGAGSWWRGFDELLHLAVDVGILEGFLAAARDFVRTAARPWHESGAEHASQDPHTIDVFGQAVARVRALRLLFDRAVDAVSAPVPLAVTTARWYAQVHGPQVINSVIGVLGASGTSQRYGLDRYWRDLATHALHHPPHWTLSEVRT